MLFKLNFLYFPDTRKKKRHFDHERWRDKFDSITFYKRMPIKYLILLFGYTKYLILLPKVIIPKKEIVAIKYIV
ncbi:hypothetical protein GLYMA_09G123900v4 [Glycine max]|uniref:Uncharacterized protein n=1 Tax=Glycine max TaxID=3847 RepID=K7LDH1_SOYBN|nr:hypothetical protein GYH30_024827 [Glycine max]KRH38278.1 hypothetical protein GLYMA_09G123900v4 [Glycine max]